MGIEDENYNNLFKIFDFQNQNNSTLPQLFFLFQYIKV